MGAKPLCIIRTLAVGEKFVVATAVVSWLIALCFNVVPHIETHADVALGVQQPTT